MDCIITLSRIQKAIRGSLNDTGKRILDNNKSKPEATAGLLSNVLNRLGSMNLAILLLLTLCLIMLAGTLTEQRQSMSYYEELYGPFWSQFFEFIQLFNLYSSPWFLLVVFLLISSISACIWRNAPRILDSYGTSAKEFHHAVKPTKSRHWEIDHYHPAKVELLEEQLHKRMFTVSREYDADDVHIYARKGSVQKLGYLFIHLAMLIIIIGGLVDGRVFSFITQQSVEKQQGDENISTTTTDVFSMLQRIEIAKPVSELSTVDNGAKKIHRLPFELQVTDSTEAYFANGQIRDYSATLSISTSDGSSGVTGKMYADKSFRYDDYTFALRGSSGTSGSVNLSLYEFGKNKLHIDNQRLTLPYQFEEENSPRFILDGFRGHNANPEYEVSLSDEFQDIGPSMSYQTLNKDSVPVRFEYYLEPIKTTIGNYYLLRATALNSSPVLIYIPLHVDGGLNHFLAFNNVLYSKELITLLVNSKIDKLFSTIELKSSFMHKELVSQITTMLQQYAEGGREAVLQHQTSEFKDADRETATLFVDKMLDSSLAMLYEQVALNEKTTGVINRSTVLSTDETIQNKQFIQSLLLAVEQLKSLGVNVFPVVHNYEQQQAVVLNISRQPGEYAVFAGMFILLMGMFLTFYVDNREYSIRIVPEENTARIYLSGYTNRQDMSFNYEFNNLGDVLMSVSV